MIKEGKFGAFEAISLVTLAITSKIFYTSAGVIVQKAGTAAWYTTLISCLITILSFAFFGILMKRFPGKNIIQIFDITFGKILGKAVTMLYTGLAIYYCGSTLREFTEMTKAYILPYTSTSLIFAAMLVPAILLSYLGLESIARVAATSLIPVLLGLATILLLAWHSYDTAFLKPFLGYGVKSTFMIGVLRSSAYMEFIILPTYILSMQDFKTFKRAGYISILLSGAVFSISLLCYLMAYGYVQGGENTVGLYELSKSIYINRFIERVESIFLFSWVVSSIISISISFYTAHSFYCNAFKIKNHRPFLLSFALLTYVVAFQPESISEVVDINMKFLRQQMIYFVHIVPIVTLLAAIILRKKGDVARGGKS